MDGKLGIRRNATVYTSFAQCEDILLDILEGQVMVETLWMKQYRYTKMFHCVWRAPSVSLKRRLHVEKIELASAETLSHRYKRGLPSHIGAMVDS